MNRVLCVVIIALLVACGALSLGLNHYRDNAITYKAQRDKNVRELKLANAAINAPAGATSGKYYPVVVMRSAGSVS
ncbi:hypothetical protein OSL73_22200, partial [Escherichia coli]|nr:hypothetical protein [Escherichia coli]